jgi:hypothetical protein
MSSERLLLQPVTDQRNLLEAGHYRPRGRHHVGERHSQRKTGCIWWQFGYFNRMAVERRKHERRVRPKPGPVLQGIVERLCADGDNDPDSNVAILVFQIALYRLLVRRTAEAAQIQILFVHGDQRLCAAMDGPAKCVGDIAVGLQPCAGLVENQNRWRDWFRPRCAREGAHDRASQRQSCQ